MNAGGRHRDYARETLRAARLALGAGFLLLVLLLGSLVALWQAYSEAVAQALALTETRSEILRLDEVLTMSAYMAAATGDPAWEARHTENAPRLDEALERARALAPGAAESIGVITSANLALLSEERDVFAHARARRLAESLAILSGDRYTAEKKNYRSGVDALDAILSERARMTAAAADQSGRLAAVLLAVGAVLCVVGERGFSARLGVLRRAHHRAEEQARQAVEDASLAALVADIGLLRGDRRSFRTNAAGSRLLALAGQPTEPLPLSILPDALGAALSAPDGAGGAIDLLVETAPGRTLLVRGRAAEDRFDVAVIDVTGQAEAERALRQLADALDERVRVRTAELEAQIDRNRRLALQVAGAEVAERRRLGTILHEDLQQLLVALRLHLASAAPSAVLTEIADRALLVSRALATDLVPAAESGDLADALDDVCALFARWHRLDVTCHIRARPATARAHVDISHSVVRELLFNVVKHADGAPVTVTLDVEPGHAVIRVRDEGPGFDPAGPGGMGLAGIRHRVAALGGSLHVDTALGAGTAIEVRVPLAPGSGAPDTDEEQPEAR